MTLWTQNERLPAWSYGQELSFEPRRGQWAVNSSCSVDNGHLKNVQLPRFPKKVRLSSHEYFVIFFWYRTQVPSEKREEIVALRNGRRQELAELKKREDEVRLARCANDGKARGRAALLAEPIFSDHLVSHRIRCNKDYHNLRSAGERSEDWLIFYKLLLIGVLTHKQLVTESTY